MPNFKALKHSSQRNCSAYSSKLIPLIVIFVFLVNNLAPPAVGQELSPDVYALLKYPATKVDIQEQIGLALKIQGKVTALVKMGNSTDRQLQRLRNWLV